MDNLMSAYATPHMLRVALAMNRGQIVGQNDKMARVIFPNIGHAFNFSETCRNWHPALLDAVSNFVMPVSVAVVFTPHHAEIHTDCNRCTRDNCGIHERCLCE